MKQFFLQGLKHAFQRDRVICRLFAAYFAAAAMVLLAAGEGFSNISYALGDSLAVLLLRLLIWFALFSAAALLSTVLHIDSWLLLVASGICSACWLPEFQQGDNNFLFLLAVIAVEALVIIFFLQANETLIRRFEPGKRTLIVLVVLAAVTACSVMATLTCLRYKTFAAPNFDFGLFCNMFYNMRKTGQPLITSERDMLLSHFAVHVSPIFYLLLPFYWLFPYPETLQIGQAAIVMAGVIPVVLLARHFGLSRKVTLLVAVLYCFYPLATTGGFYDIHENCFLTVFLLLTFLFFEKKKYLPMYLSALCVLMVKEDAAIYLLIFAVYVLLAEKRYLHGAALAVMSVSYFGVAYFLLQKYGTGVLSDRFDNLIYDSEKGIFGIINLALTNPGYLLSQLFTTGSGGWNKVMYFLQLFLPLGFLPLCTKRVSRFLLIAPLLINMLSHYQYLFDSGFQYHFGVIAFLFYAVLKSLPELTVPTRRNLLGLAAAACCCMYLMMVVVPTQGYINRWEYGKADYQQMEAVLDTVPKDASVSCSTFLLAHLADRDEIYEVRYHGTEPDVDYVVLDARYDDYKKVKLAYLVQGYTVTTELPDLIVILSRGD